MIYTLFIFASQDSTLKPQGKGKPAELAPDDTTKEKKQQEKIDDSDDNSVENKEIDPELLQKLRDYARLKFEQRTDTAITNYVPVYWEENVSTNYSFPKGFCLQDSTLGIKVELKQEFSQVRTSSSDADRLNIEIIEYIFGIIINALYPDEKKEKITLGEAYIKLQMKIAQLLESNSESNAESNAEPKMESKMKPNAKANTEPKMESKMKSKILEAEWLRTRVIYVDRIQEILEVEGKFIRTDAMYVLSYNGLTWTKDDSYSVIKLFYSNVALANNAVYESAAEKALKKIIQKEPEERNREKLLKASYEILDGPRLDRELEVAYLDKRAVFKAFKVELSTKGWLELKTSDVLLSLCNQILDALIVKIGEKEVEDLRANQVRAGIREVLINLLIQKFFRAVEREIVSQVERGE